jgi:hypothetical protein
MKRAAMGAAAVVLCTCAAAPIASAATYCVQPEASGCDQTFSTVQAALNQAGGDTSGDTVKLGATTYDGTFTLASSTNTIAIVGHGATQTLLTNSAATPPSTNLSLADTHATLSGVGIVIPSGNGNTGLSFTGEADGVAITGPSATNPTGVSLNGTFLRGTIDLPASASNTSVGVQGGTGTIEDSSVTAHSGLLAAGTNANVTARHDTFIGDGGSGSVGATAIGTSTIVTFGNATVTLDDSILRGFAEDLYRQGFVGDPNCFVDLMPCPATAFITYGYDDFDTASPKAVDNGPGTFTDNGHSVDTDPKFIGAAATPPDYHIPYNSPLVDAGMSSIESGESTQDQDGNPRTVGSATDIGAFEYQHRPPVASASATPGSAQTGSPITFSGSGSDPDPGDTVTLTWTFDDGATGSGASVTHAFATPGTHTATLTATDPTGLTAHATATVTVTSPPSPPPPTPPGGGTPVLTALNLTPKNFRAAHAGPSVAAARTGTTISYRVSLAAVTTFRVERALPGMRRGKRCVKPGRHTRRGKQCTRYVLVRGRFTHTDTAGLDRFRFTGRIGGRTLKPGRYRLDATPQAGKLIGQVTRTAFGIIR